MGLLDAVNSLNTNPAQAGLLGLATSLLAAGGPSRMPVSFGQGLAAGVQGMGQAYNATMQRKMLAEQIAATHMQNQFMRGKLGMIDALTGAQGPQQQQSAVQSQLGPQVMSYGAQQLPNGTGDQNMGGVGPTNLNAGILNNATQQVQQAQQASQSAASSLSGLTGNMISQGMLGPWLGVNNSGLVSAGLNNDPSVQRQLAIAKSPEMAAALNATGGDMAAAQALLKAQLVKNGAITVRQNGAVYMPQPDGTIKALTLPHLPQGMMPTFAPDGSVTGAAMVPGALPGIGAVAGATAGAQQQARAANTPVQVYDPATRSMVYVPQSQALSAAGGVPQRGQPTNSPEPQVSPSAGSPAPTLNWNGSTQPMSLQALGAMVANKTMSPHQATSIVADLAQRGEVDPHVAQAWVQSLPAVQASAPGLQTPAPTGLPAGPLMAAPQLGAEKTATTAANAPAKMMQQQQEQLISTDNAYQQSRDALTQMIQLAKNPGLGGDIARFLPDDIATRMSNTAAEYEKLHANFVALQGKALGGAGTDASRATLNESVPTWEKPQAAKVAGLQNQLNQLDQQHLKRLVMNGAYQSGNPDQYTQLSKQFDSAISPQIMPQINSILALPRGPALRSALQNAAKNPSLAAALNLLAENGVLK